MTDITAILLLIVATLMLLFGIFIHSILRRVARLRKAGVRPGHPLYWTIFWGGK